MPGRMIGVDHSGAQTPERQPVEFAHPSCRCNTQPEDLARPRQSTAGQVTSTRCLSQHGSGAYSELVCWPVADETVLPSVDHRAFDVEPDRAAKRAPAVAERKIVAQILPGLRINHAIKQS